MKVSNQDVFQSLKMILIFANSADPAEISHSVALHLDLNCLNTGTALLWVSNIQKVKAWLIQGTKIPIITSKI